MLTDKLHGRRNVTREQPKRIHKLFHLVCCVLTFILSNKWLQQILLLIAFETNHFFARNTYTLQFAVKVLNYLLWLWAKNI